MKRTVVMILFATMSLSFALLIGGCMNTGLRRDNNGDLIYRGNRYVSHSLSGTELDSNGRDIGLFALNYENPESAGKYFVLAWGLFPTNLEVCFSEFDTEKNILFRNQAKWTYIREGFELPDPYECRINRIVTGYDESEVLVWEAEQEFLTLNDMIDERIAPLASSIFRDSDNIGLRLFLVDYGYLYLTSIYPFFYNDKIYFYTTETYFTVKDEYAEMFKEAIALSDS